MPKTPTFPSLYDKVKTVSISLLKRHGYLKPDQSLAGIITWSRMGEGTGSIAFRVSTLDDKPYLDLDYTCNKIPIGYRVQLISKPSNIGKGVVWFFVCPHTGKRCRKLYLVNSYFYHRTAFRGCMYEKQTQSKQNRQFERTLGQYFGADELSEQLHKKHFKKKYSGKPTKKYLKLTRQIRRAESIPV